MTATRDRCLVCGKSALKGQHRFCDLIFRLHQDAVALEARVAELEKRTAPRSILEVRR